MQAPLDAGTRLSAPVTFYIVLYFFSLVKHFIIGYNKKNEFYFRNEAGFWNAKNILIV